MLCGWEPPPAVHTGPPARQHSSASLPSPAKPRRAPRGLRRLPRLLFHPYSVFFRTKPAALAAPPIRPATPAQRTRHGHACRVVQGLRAAPHAAPRRRGLGRALARPRRRAVRLRGRGGHGQGCAPHAARHRAAGEPEGGGFGCGWCGPGVRRIVAVRPGPPGIAWQASACWAGYLRKLGCEKRGAGARVLWGSGWPQERWACTRGAARSRCRGATRAADAAPVQATRCSSKQAEEAVKQLSDSGRYLKDVW